MKKYFIILSVIGLFYSDVVCGGSVKDSSEFKSDLIKDNLKGKVKKVTVNTYSAVGKSEEIILGSKIESSSIILYNKNGNKTVKNIFNIDGGLFSSSTYTYNDKMSLIKEDYMYSNLRNGYHVYTYNEKNSLIEDLQFNVELRSKSESTIKTNFIYDDKNRLSQINYNNFTRPGNNHMIRYTYDDFGNRILETYLKNGLITNSNSYKYDDKGNVVEMLVKYQDVVQEKIMYKYDQFNNQREMVDYTADGRILRKNNHEYNKSGEIIYEYDYDTTGPIENKYNYKYIYDETGNWIRKNVSLNGVINKVIIREIEYYTE